MSMKNTVQRTIRDYSMIKPDEKVLCALSGGADSLSLVLCLHELGYKICACHLNHCLRGEASDGDEEFCKSICERNGIEFMSERADAAQAAKNSGQSLETAARELRYDFFGRCLEYFGADKIATAHNADDNLETMLFRLIRGTGTAGLAGIPPVRDNIIRPLLFTERKDIEKYLREKGEQWRTDHTNEEDFCTRNKIRHQVIPALKSINPAAARQAANAAVLLRQDDEALESIAESCPKPCSADWINAQPEAVASRTVRNILKNSGVPEGETTKKHINAVLRMCANGRGNVSLPNERTAELSDGCLAVQAVKRVEGVPIALGQKLDFGDYTLLVTEDMNISDTAFLYAIEKRENLSVRCWQSGDRMTVEGSRGARTLKRLYSDRAISPINRSRLPLLCCGDEIIAAAGIGAAKRDIKNMPECYLAIWEKGETDNEHE